MGYLPAIYTHNTEEESRKQHGYNSSMSALLLELLLTCFLQGTRNTGKSIANRNSANPTAMLLASCLLLDHLRLHSYASMIRRAILSTVTETRVRPTIVSFVLWRNKIQGGKKKKKESCKKEKTLKIQIHQEWSCNVVAVIAATLVTYPQRYCSDTDCGLLTWLQFAPLIIRSE